MLKRIKSLYEAIVLLCRDIRDCYTVVLDEDEGDGIERWKP